jgi:hypothetical protein
MMTVNCLLFVALKYSAIFIRSTILGQGLKDVMLYSKENILKENVYISYGSSS